MSDSELQEQFMLLDNLVGHQEINDELQSLDDLLQELQGKEEAAPVETPKPKVSHTQWCVVSEMNSFTYGGLTCSANHSFCLKVTEDFSMGQVNILGRMPLDTETSPWWDDTFYEQGTQAVVDAMDLTQRLILQNEYHLNQAQVETNLARKTAQLLSSSSTRSAQYTYTWWDWMFRGCAIGSALIFTFTMFQCCYFRHLIRSTQESTHAALALSPLQIPVFQN
ncbi:k23 [Silurus asotus]|uniref:K23 n=1 Tax=Silurus asotus TaxID=30991 RepID=A0AAD5B935_SILAS|nr:k23 [Silurus asotus]